MPLDPRRGIANSNLGRAFHADYKHHRWVLWLIAAAVSVVSIAANLRGEPLFSILSISLNAAIAGFIGWALARELDPDRETISLLAIPLVATMVIFFGPIPVLPSAVFIGTSRFLIRITGLPPRRVEVLFIFVLPLALMFYYQNPVFGLLATLTFGLEAYFEKFGRSEETLYALFALLVTLIYIGYVGLPEFNSPSKLYGGLTAAISLLVVLKVIRMRQPQSRSDFNDQPISLVRLRGKILLTVLIAVLTLYNGDAGFLLLAPVWAALFTAGI